MADVPPCIDCPGHCAESGHRCLAAYAPDQAAMQAALDQVRLSVVTMDLPLPDPCDGSYTCQCEACVRDKVRPIRHVRQPWESRAAA